MLKINILNDGTGPDEAANYTYEVYVNLKRIASGKILGHDRSEPWTELVDKMIFEEERKEKESGKKD